MERNAGIALGLLYYISVNYSNSAFIDGMNFIRPRLGQTFVCERSSGQRKGSRSAVKPYRTA